MTSLIFDIDMINSCSGDFLTLLNCRLDQYDLGPTEDPVLVTADISQALLVTASSDGVVIVRNRRTFGSVYRESHHGDQAVVAVRLVEDLVVTGSRREVVVLRHRTRLLGKGRSSVEGEYMELVHRLDNIQLDGCITCLDTDRQSLVTGTTKCLLVWSLAQEETAALTRLVTGFLSAVLLHSPLCLTVGTSPSIELWNIFSGELLTTVGNNYYSQLVFNGRFLAAPESQRGSVHRQQGRPYCGVKTFFFNIFPKVQFHSTNVRSCASSGMLCTSIGSSTGATSLSWTFKVTSFKTTSNIPVLTSLFIADILTYKENDEEEWRQTIKSDKAGFPLVAINRYFLLMSVNNIIDIRDYKDF